MCCPQEVRAAATKPVIRLSVGLSDGISKLAAHALLGPVLDTPDLRLTCHEGEVEELLGRTGPASPWTWCWPGQGAPANPNLRLTSDRLVSSPVDWYGPARLVRKSDTLDFPRCLERLPVLLPTGHSVLRPDPGPLVQRTRRISQRGGRIRRQRANVGVCRPGPGRISAQPAGRGRHRPVARIAPPGPLRRCARGNPRHPQPPRAAPPPWSRRCWHMPRLRFFLNVCHSYSGFSEIESALSWTLF